MTPPPRCGQIVWAELADANGVRKTRPVVIVTADERITSSGPLEVVAITSRLPQPLPDDYVLLPWHAQGHPRTGLNRKCAAVCTWLARIVPTDIQSAAGIVPGAILLDIGRRIAATPSKSTATPPASPKEEQSNVRDPPSAASSSERDQS
jgi:mRNA-degrading endonuclease toxin of MazEF toxin-antitoxin module